MTVRRTSPLVVALLCGVLVAGCGSSSSSTTNGSTATSAPATSSTATSSSPAAKTTSSSPTAAPTGASAAGVQQYVEVCKSIVQREPALSASVKSKVEGICNKAANGDLAGARAAAKEVCVEVLNASPIPAAAKQKALAACKSS
jgi:hypothetical protein